jgi:4-amino-4-deoxy-L-arabinose transferase-like glycosyltransferase
MLSIHALVWCWVGTWSASNLDVPGDMAEAYAWGQSMQWGYFKHPPLSAWIVRAWFTLAPESAAGYAALASVSTALGLAGFAVLCREVLPARSVLLCVGAAMLAPGVTTMAQRFNCNAVLVLTWPWTAAFFVRFMRRGTGVDAAALGLAAALALLSKYFSVVLLGGLLSSALAVAPWRRRLWSPEAALALLVFVVCLAPHVFWLATRGGGPLAYAAAATGSDLSSALDRAARFCVFQRSWTPVSV